MNLMKIVLLPTILVFASNAWADSAESALLKSFAHCDGSMFTTLKQNQNTLQEYAPIETKGNIARFAVKGTQQTKSVFFKKPMIVNGITFTGYQTVESSLALGNNLQNAPKFYFWGFTLSPSTDLNKVAKQLPELGLEANGATMANKPQIINNVNQSLTWEANKAIKNGTLPAPNTVEKVLFLERNSKNPTLLCSIQGFIPTALLRSERPDLNAK